MTDVKLPYIYNCTIISFILYLFYKYVYIKNFHCTPNSHFILFYFNFYASPIINQYAYFIQNCYCQALSTKEWASLEEFYFFQPINFCSKKIDW